MFDIYVGGLREYAEWRMDECSRATVRRITGRTEEDPLTGARTPVWDVIEADLPCRLAGSSNATSSRTVTAGDVEAQVSTRELHVPATTKTLRDGDLAEITAGENAGAIYRLIEVDARDQATTLRIPVVAVTRPEEWSV